MSLQLDTWEPDFPKPDPIKKSGFLRIAISGPSDSGKSHLFEYFAHKYFSRLYEVFIVFCSSDDQRAKYAKILNTKHCYKSYDSSIIDTVMQAQDKKEKSGGIPFRIMIIYDDFANRSTRTDNSIFDQFISDRHSAISICMILHDIMLLDRVSRNMLTHIFMTRQLQTQVYENMAEQYLMGPFKSTSNEEIPDHLKNQSKGNIVRLLTNAMNDHTKNYNIVCILVQHYMRDQNAGLFDVLKTFKAPASWTVKK